MIELIFFGILGLAVGSFATLVAERIDTMESYLVGRSRCNSCKRTLDWFEMLPLASWLALRGRCRTCRKSISASYPFIELCFGLLFAFTRYIMPDPVNYWYVALVLVIMTCLGISFLYDLTTQYLSVPIIGFAGLVTVALVLMQTYYWFVPSQLAHVVFLTGWAALIPGPIASALVGLVVGAVIIGLIAVPSRGRWMGYGDIFLAGLLGLWLGYPGIIVTIVLAFYIGAIVGIFLLVWRKYSAKQAIAFGPFLILGGLVTFFYGEAILNFAQRIWGIN